MKDANKTTKCINFIYIKEGGTYIHSLIIE